MAATTIVTRRPGEGLVARFHSKKAERPIIGEYSDILEWLLDMRIYTENQLYDVQRRIDKAKYAAYKERLRQQRRSQERPDG